MTVFYIVPAHNKENLIRLVLDGIVTTNSRQEDSRIICILDGCTDGTESIVENYKSDIAITILKADDVHEILSLNTGLNYIKNNCDPQDNDLVFMIQDDVVLGEKDIDIRFRKLFNKEPNLGYVSMRMGASLKIVDGHLEDASLLESEFGHWNQLGSKVHQTVKHNTLKIVECAIRSPTCMLWERFNTVGFFDEKLAPAGFDCHDMSIRLNIAGYNNALYTMRYRSDVSWGTMRQPEKIKNRSIYDTYGRNRMYLAEKHKDYFK
jgi:glycosyltransferase involved in cell wall biosynthesis